jgi:hypothetical protein
MTLGLYPTAGYTIVLALRVGAMALIWSLWLCMNDKGFFLQKVFSLAGYISTDVRPLSIYGHNFTTRRSRPLLGGVYVPGGYNEIPIFRTWMVA